MIIILYLSVALIAVAFLILVIYLSKTLKSVQMTLTNVASTLDGLEGQMKALPQRQPSCYIRQTVSRKTFRKNQRN